jgi:serine/threonine protein kinase/tetratricopeptide (TPR) repeat protein
MTQLTRSCPSCDAPLSETAHFCSECGAPTPPDPTGKQPALSARRSADDRSLQERLRRAMAARYPIERELGAGGMATVYLAEDLKHRRQVAVKVLRPELAAALGTDRFLREIDIAARLHHPHILPLYDSGETEGFLYYVMPYIEGQSLRGRLTREGQLPIPEVVQIAHEISDALAYAHARGVVHRDIKPDNVMLSGRHALVMDFGVAKAVSEAAGADQLTTAGVSLGTPTYMAPEQAAGDPQIDGRADLYALGVLTYELLAGQPPFTGATPQAVVVAHITRTPEPVTAHRPVVSPGLARVVMRCLAKNADDRWQSADDLLLQLEGADTPGAGRPHTKVEAAETSVAVLPFANMSADPENEYFSDGITEELINALSKLAGLQVASRTSSFALKGKELDVREVGEKLGVSSVLEGSVRKAGNRLRITAQLINVADGYQLWSDRFDREAEDVFAIQDEIAESIVQALRVVLSDEEKKAIEKAAPRADVEAYDYYLRGRQFFHQFRKSGLEYARQMFARAIEIDPDYARAHAGIADCCSFLYMYWDASTANLEQADSTSRKALELDPELADAHAARGLAVSLKRQYDEAHREFETAIRLNPKLYEGYYFYGRACFQQGKLEQAVELFQRASEIRPEDYQAPYFVAQAYSALGEESKSEVAILGALEVTKRYLDLNPDDARALYFGANELAQIGETDKAERWVRRALAIDPDDVGVLYNVACAYARLGKSGEAIDCLERAVKNGFGHREWIEQDPDLNPIRDDPRFQALLGRV